jgi:hypothetical protein
MPNGLGFGGTAVDGFGEAEEVSLVVVVLVFGREIIVSCVLLKLDSESEMKADSRAGSGLVSSQGLCDGERRP